MGHIEVPQPGASQILGRLLTEALREHPDVQWLGLMSEDGFAIAAEGVSGVDDDAVAAGAVRMMVQVRAMSKALGQTGTSQLFLEGSDSGICVIDKDPWVLVMVGAPGVPIGLLRYEAREIAEAFPMGRQAQLPSATEAGEGQEGGAGGLGDEQSQWWEEDLAVPAEPVSEPEPEIRWADEPTSDTPSGEAGQEAPVTDFSGWDFEVTEADAGEPAAELPVEPELEIRWADEPTSDTPSGEAGPQAPVTDFSAWSFAADDAGSGERQAEESPVEIGTPTDPAAVAAGFAFDDLDDLVPPPPAPASAPDSAVPPVPAGLIWDLGDLAPPSGPAIELPPPAGPVFELPPPE